MKYIKSRFAPIVLALGLSAGVAPKAHADCLGLIIPPPEDLNICRELVEDLVIDPIIGHRPNCNISGLACLGLPHCCVPGACLAFPECWVYEDFIEVAGYIAHAGDVYCGPQEITAEEIFDDIVEDRVTDLTSLATGGTNSYFYKHAGAHIDVLACSADKIPSSLRSVISTLSSTIANPGFSSIEIGRADLLRESEATAGFYLAGHSAITLDSLIIMRDHLTEAALAFNRPWDEVMNRQLTADQETVITLLAHELVHVRQYRVMGREAFLNTYFAQIIKDGYANAATENEANLHEGFFEEELEAQRKSWEALIGIYAGPLI